MSGRPEQSLKSTKSYIWYTGHVLGTGATSNVYIGRHKKTGEQVAVKTFNNASYSRPIDVQVRELDVLKKIKHKNIVDLLAIEDDQISKQPVIIMELCMGGSLYSILEEPENIFGLKEDEFLIVLRDVTSGMKYLRETNIVHRDLKPGNIMRVVAEDNTSIYKLADFGAARELQDGGEFMSLYGTEEYLHPDLYQRAVLKVANRGSYSAVIDLWSVGVTLYHVATGQLPFRPFGGRKNRETMIYLTTKKPNGVISGVQHDSTNGEIVWSSQLPETSHLPSPLKKQVKRLLAGLLECNIDKMYSFNKFFDTVQEIMSLKKVHVFNAVTSQAVSIYISPRDRWDAFATKVVEETHVAHGQQIMCFKGLILDTNKLFMENTHFPETTLENPIILFRGDLMKFPLPIPPPRPKLPKIATPYSLENDAPLAKICCGSMYFFLLIVKSYLLMEDQMGLAVKCFCNILESKIREIELNLEKLKTQQVYFEETLKWLLSNLDQNLVLQIVDQNLQLMSEGMRQMHFDKVQQTASLLKGQLKMLDQDYQREIASQLNAMFDEFHGLFRKIIRDKVLENAYDDKQKCQPKEHCYARFEVLVKETKTIADQFKDDKRAKRLAYNEEQIHKMDKQKLSMQCTQGVSLLTDHCETKWREQHNRLGTWYTRAYFDFQSIIILMERIDSTMMNFTIFRTRLDEFKLQQEQAYMDIAQAFQEAMQRMNSVYMRGLEPTHSRPSTTFIHTSQERTSMHGKRNALVSIDQLRKLNEYQKEMKLMRDDVHEGVNHMKNMRIER